MAVSPDSGADESGPWAQTVNTYTWVLEQQYRDRDQRDGAEFFFTGHIPAHQSSEYGGERRQRQRVASTGMGAGLGLGANARASINIRVFEPEWAATSTSRGAWEEKAFDVDAQARVWMLQEEARRIAAQREAERTRVVQEEVRRIQFRIQLKREAERQRIMEERRRAQEEAAREREARKRETTSRAIAAAWQNYENVWANISSSTEQLTFRSIPWPMANPPISPAAITMEAISAFLFSSSHSVTQSRKDRIKEALRRWHPDRFGRLLKRVIDEERGIVEEGVGIVARCLNELLSQQSQPSSPRPVSLRVCACDSILTQQCPVPQPMTLAI